MAKIDEEKTNELKNSLLSASSRQIREIVDIGLRHKPGIKPTDFLEQWLKIARCFAYATRDDSWGEFEKEFAIIVRRMVVAERELSIACQENDIINLLRNLYESILAAASTRQESAMVVEREIEICNLTVASRRILNGAKQLISGTERLEEDLLDLAARLLIILAKQEAEVEDILLEQYHKNFVANQGN